MLIKQITFLLFIHIQYIFAKYSLQRCRNWVHQCKSIEFLNNIYYNIRDLRRYTMDKLLDKIIENMKKMIP